jgi:hypothetical protein
MLTTRPRRSVSVNGWITISQCNEAAWFYFKPLDKCYIILVPHLLWNQKTHCRLHRDQLLFPIPSQMNPLHVLITYSFMTYFKVILAFTPSSSNWFLMVSFSNKNFVGIFQKICACFMLHPSQLPQFVTLIILGFECKLGSSLINRHYSASCYFLWSPNTIFSILLHVYLTL